MWNAQRVGLRECGAVQMQVGSQAVDSTPRFPRPGGEHSEGSLCRSRAGSELLLCRGPAAPREERVCPGLLREGLGWVPAKGAGTSSAFLQIGHNDSNPNPTYLI